MGIYDRDWYREEYKEKEKRAQQGHTTHSAPAPTAPPTPPRPQATATKHALTPVKIAAFALAAGVASYLVLSVILDHI
ncbi:hypothetical protein [Burkholderia pseudomallei]|uniref:hypothetical protein n=1 Tax=Burkholderia pseudomallei TaxID=28450 RepID=UPI000A1A12DF|nr:hypothetical protein [Burkholderia pseudomallei]ARK49168.1 hypothetical protein BOC35_23515 [Burkholderia pseudomallei]MCL4670281.1 hypothetical protein [Burkholderia pseudomallei]MEB5483296.1 hypothetical protein [Burkholderia pseudomallei]MEB5490149.1 hypothetical protein [Burkholderia pseudomallei]MEB5496547.1 hypothetical protein [Burkholderia pseudomallei]